MQKIQILAFLHKAGISKKTLNAYEMDIAQCVLHGEAGEINVGELTIPKETKAELGYFSAVLHLVSRDGKLQGMVKSLTPWVEPAFKPKAA